MNSKNFSFVKSIDEEKYRLLCKIEHDAYISPLSAARTCTRSLYESILKDLLNEAGIESSSDITEMYDKIREHDLRLPKTNKLPRKNVKCYLSNQAISIETMNAYDFLKNLGNASSHNDPYPRYDSMSNPIPNSENVFYALELFHIILQMIYESEIREDVGKFNIKDIPIGDYSVENEIPGIADKARTNCVKEYIVYRNATDNVNNKLYGLIREYDVNGINKSNKLAFDRMHDVYGVLGNQLRREGLTFRPLNIPEEKYTNFFVVYEYDVDMIPLRQFLRNETLSVQDRLELCLNIAKQIRLFHSAEPPVYLRLLSYDNIMVRLNPDNTTDKYDTFIIKYEFSKIAFKDSDKSGLTVLELVQSANKNDIGLNERISRYCLNTEVDEGTDWEKVDVGSLGVLFADICKGDITRIDPYDLVDELKGSEGIPDRMIDLITSMMDPVNMCRPTLEKVIDEMTSIVTD